LLGLPWIREIADVTPKHDEPVNGTTHEMPAMGKAMTEAEAQTTASVWPSITAIAPQLFYSMAGLFVLAGIGLAVTGIIALDDAVALGLGGGFGAAMAGYITSNVAAALRDRVIA